jgi:cyclopropane fatty-acyl-phospholipid synthase-like methyltransferase
MTLIDKEYQKQLAELHKSDKKFNHGAKAYKIVEEFIAEYKPTTLLDFGCGKGGLIATISELHPDISVAGYDPGNPEFSQLPTKPFDVVISTDAIEHIEPAYLEETLKAIGKLMTRCGCFRIACYPAKKNLPDGRNAHLIVKTPDWWREKLITLMGVKIASEQISIVDKTDKWPQVKGHNYDVVVYK